MAASPCSAETNQGSPWPDRNRRAKRAEGKRSPGGASRAEVRIGGAIRLLGAWRAPPRPLHPPDFSLGPLAPRSYPAAAPFFVGRLGEKSGGLRCCLGWL